MSILEILEAHDYRIVEEQFKGHGKVKTIVCNCGDRYGFFETHRKHQAQALEQHVQSERRAAWFDGQKAGWEEAKDPGAFVNDVWDAKTPNPYADEEP